MTVGPENQVSQDKERTVQSFTDYADQQARTVGETPTQGEAKPAKEMNPYEVYGEDYYA